MNLSKVELGAILIALNNQIVFGNPIVTSGGEEVDNRDLKEKIVLMLME